MRSATASRDTKETQIRIELELDGDGTTECSTGLPFFDHMLDQLGRHGGFNLTVAATGDLEIDSHHTVEDTGILLGSVFKEALGDKKGIRRYGHFTLPMDESLVTAAIDLSGRCHVVFGASFPSSKIGEFDTELVEEFWRGFAGNALCNLHILLHHGSNSHHISEAIFKGVARAFRMAIESDDRMTGVPSTKGTLS